MSIDSYVSSGPVVLAPLEEILDDRLIKPELRKDGKAKPAPDLRTPRKLWGQEHYQALAALTRDGLTGRQLMERCGVGRRDTMKAILQDAQDAGYSCSRVSWEEEATGKSRNPRQLKADKSGNLHISNKRFAFYGMSVSEGDRFTLVLRENTLVLERTGKISTLF